MLMMKYLCGLALSFVLFGGVAHAAEFTLQPALTLGEEYNDNIFLQSVNPQSDYITIINPSFTGHYQSQLWTWDGNASLLYLYYDKHNQDSQSLPAGTVRNLTDLWSDVLYFEGIENYRRVSLYVINDYTTQSYIVNQTNQNTVTLHPYLELKPFQNTAVRLEYDFIDTRYSESLGIYRIDNIVNVDSATEVSSRLTVTVGARETRETNDVDNYEEDDVYTGLRYQFGERSEIFALVTKTWLRYEIGGEPSYLEWNAGIIHNIAEYTLRLESGRIPLPNPTSISEREDFYQVTVIRAADRSSISVAVGLLNYEDSITNEILDIERFAKGSFLYRFTPRLSATATSLYQDTKDRASSSYIYFGQSSLTVDYQLTQKLTMSLAYTRNHSYAPVLTANDYTNNQGLVQFKMTF